LQHAAQASRSSLLLRSRLSVGLRSLSLVLLLAVQPLTGARADVDERSTAGWNTLLAECVSPTAGGHSTAVDYDCFAARRPTLQNYLDALSAVSAQTFAGWPRDQQLAFLINAYNAWTIELIVRAWPDIESIRDLGSLLRSPWKKAFIPLLDRELNLDDIEHGMIREPGRFDEPRIHFAVNCASVGCPALRREAYTATMLEAQLEDQTESFLADRSRNRLRDGELEISSIFKWYGDDFRKGWRGKGSLEAFLAGYSDALSLSEAQRKALLEDKLDVAYLDYDWRLNTAANSN
jgi:hypothetical protein